MATGTYTSKERVERDGRLVAFAGEVMTMEEAEARGLVKKASKAAKAKTTKAKATEAKDAEATEAAEEVE